MIYIHDSCDMFSMSSDVLLVINVLLLRNEFSSASVTAFAPFGLVTHTKEVSMLSYTFYTAGKKWLAQNGSTWILRSSSPVNRRVVVRRHASFIWHNEVITKSRLSTGTQTFSCKAWKFWKCWVSFSSPFSYDDSHGIEKWFAYAFSSLFEWFHWSTSMIPIPVYMKALQSARWAGNRQENDSIMIQSHSLSHFLKSQFKSRLLDAHPVSVFCSKYLYKVMQTAMIPFCAISSLFTSKKK